MKFRSIEDLLLLWLSYVSPILIVPTHLFTYCCLTSYRQSLFIPLLFLISHFNHIEIKCLNLLRYDGYSLPMHGVYVFHSNHRHATTSIAFTDHFNLEMNIPALQCVVVVFFFNLMLCSLSLWGPAT